MIRSNSFIFLNKLNQNKENEFISKDASFQLINPALTVDEWVREEERKLVEISVTDVPAKKCFLIETRGLPILNEHHERTVERSFRDFQLLRDALQKRFAGSCPPPLPENQKSILAQQATFKRKQLRFLHLFLEEVANHSFLRNDEVFELFIGSPALFESALGTISNRSEGLERWRQALQKAPVPKDAFYLIESTRNELKLLEKNLSNLKQSCKQEIDASTKRAECTKKMVQAFDQWVNCERSLRTPLGGNVKIELSDFHNLPTTEVSIPDNLQIVINKYTEHGNCLQAEGLEVELTILDWIRYELNSIGNWISHIDDALNAEKKVLRCMNNVENNSTNAKNLEVAKRELVEVKSLALIYERGLLSLELGRFKKSRILRTMLLREAVVDMHMKASRSITDIWRHLHSGDAPPPSPVARTSFVLPIEANQNVINNNPVNNFLQKLNEPPRTEARPGDAVIFAPAAPRKDPDGEVENKMNDVLTEMRVRAIAEEVAKMKAAAAPSAPQMPTTIVQEVIPPNIHDNCYQANELARLFTILIYCTVSVHGLFIGVYVFRGYFKEAFTVFVLSVIVFLAGKLIQIVHDLNI